MSAKAKASAGANPFARTQNSVRGFITRHSTEVKAALTKWGVSPEQLKLVAFEELVLWRLIATPNYEDKEESTRTSMISQFQYRLAISKKRRALLDRFLEVPANSSESLLMARYLAWRSFAIGKFENSDDAMGWLLRQNGWLGACLTLLHASARSERKTLIGESLTLLEALHKIANDVSNRGGDRVLNGALTEAFDNASTQIALTIRALEDTFAAPRAASALLFEMLIETCQDMEDGSLGETQEELLAWLLKDTATILVGVSNERVEATTKMSGAFSLFLHFRTPELGHHVLDAVKQCAPILLANVDISNRGDVFFEAHVLVVSMATLTEQLTDFLVNYPDPDTLQVALEVLVTTRSLLTDDWTTGNTVDEEKRQAAVSKDVRAILSAALGICVEQRSAKLDEEGLALITVKLIIYEEAFWTIERAIHEAFAVHLTNPSEVLAQECALRYTLDMGRLFKAVFTGPEQLSEEGFQCFRRIEAFEGKLVKMSDQAKSLLPDHLALLSPMFHAWMAIQEDLLAHACSESVRNDDFSPEDMRMSHSAVDLCTLIESLFPLVLTIPNKTAREFFVGTLAGAVSRTVTAYANALVAPIHQLPEPLLVDTSAVAFGAEVKEKGFRKFAVKAAKKADKARARASTLMDKMSGTPTTGARPAPAAVAGGAGAAGGEEEDIMEEPPAEPRGPLNVRAVYKQHKEPLPRLSGEMKTILKAQPVAKLVTRVNNLWFVLDRLGVVQTSVTKRCVQEDVFQEDGRVSDLAAVFGRCGATLMESAQMLLDYTARKVIFGDLRAEFIYYMYEPTPGSNLFGMSFTEAEGTLRPIIEESLNDIDPQHTAEFAESFVATVGQALEFCILDGGPTKVLNRRHVPALVEDVQTMERCFVELGADLLAVASTTARLKRLIGTVLDMPSNDLMAAYEKATTDVNANPTLCRWTLLRVLLHRDDEGAKEYIHIITRPKNPLKKDK